MTKPKVVMVLANNFEDSEAIEPKNHLEALGADVYKRQVFEEAVVQVLDLRPVGDEQVLSLIHI